MTIYRTDWRRTTVFLTWKTFNLVTLVPCMIHIFFSLLLFSLINTVRNVYIYVLHLVLRKKKTPLYTCTNEVKDLLYTILFPIACLVTISYYFSFWSLWVVVRFLIFCLCIFIANCHASVFPSSERVLCYNKMIWSMPVLFSRISSYAALHAFFLI